MSATLFLYAPKNSLGPLHGYQNIGKQQKLLQFAPIWSKLGLWWEEWRRHQHDCLECSLGTLEALQQKGCIGQISKFAPRPQWPQWRLLRNGTWYLAFNFHADVVGTVLQWMLACKGAPSLNRGEGKDCKDAQVHGVLVVILPSFLAGGGGVLAHSCLARNVDKITADGCKIKILGIEIASVPLGVTSIRFWWFFAL